MHYSPYKRPINKRNSLYLILIFIPIGLFAIVTYGAINRKAVEESEEAVSNATNAIINWIQPKIKENLISVELLLSGFEQNDSLVVEEIRKKFLIQPSNKPYNLSKPNEDSNFGQVPVIKRILKDKTSGFFIESRAHDGEKRSNTLSLERFYNWTGVLVEFDEIEILKTKNRRAFISPVCLSPSIYPGKKILQRIENSVEGRLNTLGFDFSQENEKLSEDQISHMQCFPMASILFALNVKVVDYWSLNVDGGEMDVIYNFPFDSILVKTISIGHHSIGGKDSLKSLMFSKGFNFVEEVHSDYIFAHKSLNYHKLILNDVAFKNELTEECINTFGLSMEFTLALFPCNAKNVYQQTFYLSKEGVMRHLEGGCWKNDAADESIKVVRCNEENFHNFPKWIYVPEEGTLIHEDSGKCVTALEGIQLRLKSCEKKSSQKWNLIQETNYSSVQY